MMFNKMAIAIYHKVSTMYSQTCEQRPPKGNTEYVLYRQVVFILEVALFNLINEKLSKYGLYLQGGRYSEVVFNTSLTI